MTTNKCNLSPEQEKTKLETQQLISTTLHATYKGAKYQKCQSWIVLKNPNHWGPCAGII